MLWADGQGSNCDLGRVEEVERGQPAWEIVQLCGDFGGDLVDLLWLDYVYMSVWWESKGDVVATVAKPGHVAVLVA